MILYEDKWNLIRIIMDLQMKEQEPKWHRACNRNMKLSTIYFCVEYHDQMVFIM